VYPEHIFSVPEQKRERKPCEHMQHYGLPEGTRQFLAYNGTTPFLITSDDEELILKFLVLTHRRQLGLVDGQT
jgi:hypothetical protein